MEFLINNAFICYCLYAVVQGSYVCYYYLENELDQISLFDLIFAFIVSLIITSILAPIYTVSFIIILTKKLKSMRQIKCVNQ